MEINRVEARTNPVYIMRADIQSRLTSLRTMTSFNHHSQSATRLPVNLLAFPLKMLVQPATSIVLCIYLITSSQVLLRPSPQLLSSPKLAGGDIHIFSGSDVVLVVTNGNNSLRCIANSTQMATASEVSAVLMRPTFAEG